MNRRFVLTQLRRSDEHTRPATPHFRLQTCRCYTHLGASQDSRAG
ncbi:hypothetical protein [Pseudenterobacter timonensis]